MMLYLWTYSLRNTTNEACLQKIGDWKDFTDIAGTYIQMLRHQLDFWGRELSFAPLLSFDALFSNVQSLLHVGRGLEVTYNSYMDEWTDEDNQLSIARKTTH